MKKCFTSLIALTLGAMTLFATPKAVVFDFGGVLTTQPNRQLVKAFLQDSFHLSEEEFDLIKNPPEDFSKPDITDPAFWMAYAEEKDLPLPGDWELKFKSVMKEAIGVNPKMYDLVEELKAENMPVVLFSNIDDVYAQLLREFGLYTPFDHCLLSCDIGAEKPDNAAYEILLKELGLSAEEIVFIDDRSENIVAAEQLGLDAILFTSEKDLRKALSERHLLMSGFAKSGQEKGAVGGNTPLQWNKSRWKGS